MEIKKGSLLEYLLQNNEDPTNFFDRIRYIGANRRQINGEDKEFKEHFTDEYVHSLFMEHSPHKKNITEILNDWNQNYCEEELIREYDEIRKWVEEKVIF